MFKRTLASTVAGLAILAVGPDLKIDTAKGQSLALEEIVVTARKREESLQDIPVSVTAFTADQIERAGFMNLEDISMQTTGMQFNTNIAGTRPGRLFQNIRIRGLEGGEFTAATSIQVASVFVDGIFALQAGQSLSLMDLERVEVIKGPQSAQFARNSFAGAINYITSTPSLDEYSGKLQIEAATYEQHEAQFSIEGPLIENSLAFRLSARSFKKGSMYTASDGGDLGEQTSKSVSGVLYAEPNENWSLKLRGYYQRDADGPNASGYLQGRLNDTCTGTTRPGLDPDFNPITLSPVLFYCGQVPGPGELPGLVVDSNTKLFPQILGATQPNFLVDQLLNFQGAFRDIVPVTGTPQLEGFGLERNIIRVSLVSTYEMDNGITITATGAYNDNEANDFRDWDFTPVEAWYVTNPQKGDDKSFDLRVSSSDDSDLRWMVGGNYFDQKFLTSGGGGVLVFTCGNFGALFGIGDNCDSPFFAAVPTDGGDTVDTWGVYGSASYDVGPLTLDLEARYQQDKRGDGISDFQVTYKQFLPRATLSYKPTEDLNLYVNYSIGRNPGVVNGNIITCNDTPYTVPFISTITGQPSTSSECEQYREQLGDAFGPFTPEQKLESYEAGIKSTWFDGRLLFNIAAYWYDWANQPTNTFATLFLDDDGDGVPNDNPNFNPVADSGGSKTYGFEIESAFVLADGWTTNANLTYNENEFKNFIPATASATATFGQNVNIKGNRSSRFPKWSGNLVSQYTQPLNADWDYYVRGDIMYNGKHVAGLTNLAIMNDYFLVNARVSIERNNLRVEAFVKNVFDEDNWRAGSEFTDFSIIDSPSVFDFNKLGIILIPQDRRTFGMRVSYGF